MDAERESPGTETAGGDYQIKRVAYLKRSTAGLAEPPLPEFEHLQSASELAPVMLAAYIGTPDYEGEDLAATVTELELTYAGKYGPLFPDASFVAVQHGEPVGAVVVFQHIKTGKLDARRPHIGFLFTIPEYQGQGIATQLLKAAAFTLQEHGYEEMGLVVNLENTRALRLYEHLGFTKQ